MDALRVNDLRVHFATARGPVRAVDGVSFDLHAGQTLALVGESGCGKSVTSMAVMGLLKQSQARVAGSVQLIGEELLAATEGRMRQVRGSKIGMVFQEPMTSLNPVLTAGYQIAETLRVHEKIGRTAARRRAVELLQSVGIPDPERRYGEYPHQLSGGMRQRVMIAIALACRPEVLIADEPTTALDVTIQAQILDLMRQVSRDSGLAILLITHDLGVVAEMAQRVVVMYAGRVVEEAAVGDLFREPLHPYSQGLLRLTPRLGSREKSTHATMPGSPPPLHIEIQGCAFAPRCPRVEAICTMHAPALEAKAPGHAAACHFARRVAG
ncbi:ABC transporter ATP-binding protein [Variovorax sp. LT1R20]|uniref:ABC transporter ATP-binding protein n=1 Tax=Variovorax sp. LT1R20 TaxID=3443729 RepID=UPI003F4718E9